MFTGESQNASHDLAGRWKLDVAQDHAASALIPRAGYLPPPILPVSRVSPSFSETRFPFPQNSQEQGIEDPSAGLLHTDN